LREAERTSGRRLLIGVMVVFLATALLAAIDIGADLDHGTSQGHVVAEAAILVVGLLGALLVGRRLLATLRRAHAAVDEARSLAGELAATAAEAARWRTQARELMAGLGEAIDEQFSRWQLSTAEKEVGLLLLKGLSHREIAKARGVAEETARQQARAVYRKAGLTGRHDLAAFFLEDLMLPREGGAVSHEAQGAARRARPADAVDGGPPGS